MIKSPARAAIAALLSVVVLASCGRTDGGSEDSASAAASTIGTDSATGTITVWAMGDEGGYLTDLVEQFEEENPDVTVEVTTIPWESSYDKIQTAIASGEVPDVVQVGTTYMASFADAFATVPSDLDTSDLLSSSLDTATVDGELVAVPWYVETRVLYYRTDLAAEAGWDSAPTSWDELYQMAADMQALDEVDYGIKLGNKGTDSYISDLWAGWSNGASLTNEDGTEWTLDTAEWQEGFEYIESFYSAGIADVNADTDTGAMASNFVSGSTPMFIMTPSQMSLIEEYGGEGFEDSWTTAVLPGKESGDTGVSFIGGSNLAVFNESDNQNAAWKLVQWLSEPDVQVDFYELSGDLPASETAWDDETFTGSKVSAFGEQLENTVATPSVTTWAEVSSAGDTVKEQITRGTVSVADGLADLQSQAESIGMGD